MYIIRNDLNLRGEKKMKIESTLMETYTLPTLPVRGIIPLPNSEVSLEIGRPQSIQAIEAAELNGKYIVLIPQKDANVDNPKNEDLAEYGTIAKITMKIKLPNGHYKVKFKSIVRAKVLEFNEGKDFYESVVETTPSIIENSLEETTMLNLLMNQIKDFGAVIFKNASEVRVRLEDIESSDEISDIIAFYLDITNEEKIKYLPLINLKERMMYILRNIEEKKEIVELELRINQEIKRSVDKSQKEFYLYEKIKASRKEMGEDESKESLAQVFKDKVNTLEMPVSVREKALEEIRRFEMLPSNSSESGVIRTYIEWLLAIPWSIETKDNDDIIFAEKVLDSHHFGLEEVKDRILEYLAVKTITGKNPPTILCLVGPPGVGKTSLAKSIAEALGRKFVKISLGGVKDESEIRGHRRTYLGALPGRLIQGMKKAGTINPVILLDEIDKMASDYKGDPASAMLEVLDPEQNKKFSDHYLEEEYDLSKVVFIATANTLDTISAPLRDRMDIIQVSSYTEEEKFEIAKHYLVDRQLQLNGLSHEKIKIEDSVLLEIIRHYTLEAGVRQLERSIGAICRKTARELLKKKSDEIVVNHDRLIDYLGQYKIVPDMMEKEDQIGFVMGLAYTTVGGNVLPLEVNYYKGKGGIVLTGKLGDVMKESAQIAVSYVRANAESFGIDNALFTENDLHIHAPDGSIPKDGPSAGLAMVTAIVSALTKRPVRREVGMTGEVTLRGRATVIGGLKEKTIAAHRAGLKTVIIPQGNEKDIPELPQIIRDELEIIPVSHVNEVLEIALALEN